MFTILKKMQLEVAVSAETATWNCDFELKISIGKLKHDMKLRCEVTVKIISPKNHIESHLS